MFILNNIYIHHFSLSGHLKYYIHYLICLIILAITFGCYSFTGGSIPPHLKTLNIGEIEDNSGIGNPLYREVVAQKLFEKFRNDNSLKIVEGDADAILNVRITSITDQPLTVQSDELATENKVIVSCDADYYDNVKKKDIWSKRFQNQNVYSIGSAQAGRDEAIIYALDKTADDILLAVISGW